MAEAAVRLVRLEPPFVWIVPLGWSAHASLSVSLTVSMPKNESSCSSTLRELGIPGERCIEM